MMTVDTYTAVEQEYKSSPALELVLALLVSHQACL